MRKGERKKKRKRMKSKTWREEARLTGAANVDEVFVDLCRQIIRKDNSAISRMEDDLYAHRKKHRQHSHHRSRKQKKESRCVIL